MSLLVEVFPILCDANSSYSIFVNLTQYLNIMTYPLPSKLAVRSPSYYLRAFILPLQLLIVIGDSSSEGVEHSYYSLVVTVVSDDVGSEQIYSDVRR